uniref:Uncharacterized protein n=1 Tax=Romanomermis culicivorax TaxID=13658 RepID=A0A915K8U4_ROMCU
MYLIMVIPPIPDHDEQRHDVIIGICRENEMPRIGLNLCFCVLLIYVRPFHFRDRKSSHEACHRRRSTLDNVNSKAFQEKHTKQQGSSKCACVSVLWKQMSKD